MRHVQGANLMVMANATGPGSRPGTADGRRVPAAPIHAVDAASGLAACGERPLVVLEDLPWPPEAAVRCRRCVRELTGGLASY